VQRERKADEFRLPKPGARIANDEAIDIEKLESLDPTDQS
jgi:hypothetical protein